MEKYKYTCNYCQIEYIPTKRGKQKYCKASCRERAYQIRKKKKKEIDKVSDLSKNDKIKIDQMSMSGIGNATAGSLIADTLKAFLTKNEDKPATKGDMLSILSHIERFQKITNMDRRIDGAQPYFDMETKKVVYLGGNNLDNLVV